MPALRLYYYPLANFGDQPLNEWLWPQLLPGCLDPRASDLLVGIGSLLNDRLPRAPLKVIFGAGAGYGDDVPRPDERWRVYCVRGPLTAQRLGLPAEHAISDGAVLVAAVRAPLAERHGVAFMPHWNSARYGFWRAVCQAAGLRYIDPTAEAEAVIAGLAGAERVITESLHGAIVADALRVPWIPVRAYRHILDFKWHDWCASVGLHYEPEPLLPLYRPDAVKQHASERLAHWRRPVRAAAQAAAALAAGALYPGAAAYNRRALARLARHGRPRLSAEPALAAVLDRLLARLDELRADLARGAFQPAAPVHPS